MADRILVVQYSSPDKRVLQIRGRFEMHVLLVRCKPTLKKRKESCGTGPEKKKNCEKAAHFGISLPFKHMKSIKHKKYCISDLSPLNSRPVLSYLGDSADKGNVLCFKNLDVTANRF